MASSGRHKALEEGKQRIREKVAEIKAQQEAIVQYVAEIVQKVRAHFNPSNTTHANMRLW